MGYTDNKITSSQGDQLIYELQQLNEHVSSIATSLRKLAFNEDEPLPDEIVAMLDQRARTNSKTEAE